MDIIAAALRHFAVELQRYLVTERAQHDSNQGA